MAEMDTPSLITGKLTQEQWLLLSSAVARLMYNKFVDDNTRKEYQHLYGEMKNQGIWQ
jgi:hypothetical protein